MSFSICRASCNSLNFLVSTTRSFIISQRLWPRSRISWRRRFISSKSSFRSRSEDDSTVFFPVPFLLPVGRTNSS
ncbi:hypothetical protein Hanom_Chr10g00887701 [Helianthus anomalus]